MGMLTEIDFYGGSKAALMLVSETLRLEMAPLGVKVATIVTGAVETNIMANGPEVKLPDDSLYLAVEENIVARGKGADVKSKMKSKDFADRVVSDILGGANGKVWRGEMASTVKYATAYLPSFMMVSLFVLEICVRC